MANMITTDFTPNVSPSPHASNTTPSNNNVPDNM